MIAAGLLSLVAISSCDWQENVAIVGFELDSVGGVASRDACCGLCTANMNCASSTFHSPKNKCILSTNSSATTACGAGCATAIVRKVAHQGGKFGTWQVDSNGAPVYVYTCDQNNDPAAVSQPSPNVGDRSATEHVFQLGNSRITLVASNYGAFKLRQDEGGPKWLLGAADDAAGPSAKENGTQYGAGFGYLHSSGGGGSSDNMRMSTYYSSPASDHAKRSGSGSDSDSVAGSDEQRGREFGVGFARNNVTSSANQWHVSHTVAVPPGDDPIAVLQATLALSHLDPFYERLADRHKFSATHYHSSFSHLSNKSSGSDSSSSASSTSPSSSSPSSHARDSDGGETKERKKRQPLHGLSVRREWLGLSATDQAVFEALAKDKLPTAPNTTWWDIRPAESFLVLLPESSKGVDHFGKRACNDDDDDDDDDKCNRGGGGGGGGVEYGTDARAYFGSGGVKTPAGELKFTSKPSSELDSAMIVRVPLTVPAGKTAKVCMLLGYIPPRDGKFSVEELARKYATACAGDGGVVTNIAGQWKGKLTTLEVEAAPAAAIGQELAWHSYYLQGGASYDDYFMEHIVDQGLSYRYTIGFQGAARDPAQHALGLLLTAPNIAKSVLRYTLKEMQTTFGTDPLRPTDVPYAMSGHGVKLAGLGLDLPIFGAAGKGNHPSDMEMYILLLAAEYMLATRDVAFLQEEVPYYNSTVTHTVQAALCKMLRFSTRTVGIGPHGLMRLLTSDWDDGLGPPDNALNVSESVLNAALATYALPRFAEALRFANVEPEAADEADAFAKNQSIALLAAGWDHEAQWLRRAWLGDQVGWVGGANRNASNTRGGLFSSQHGFAFLGNVFKNETEKQSTAVTQINKRCRGGHYKYGYAYNCDHPFSVDSGEGAGMWPALDYPMAMGLSNIGLLEEAWQEFERNSLHWQATVTPQQWSGIWTSGDFIGLDGKAGSVGNNYPAFCMHRHAWLGATAWSSPAVSLAWDPVKQTYTGHYSPSTPSQVDITVDLSLRHPAVEEGDGVGGGRESKRTNVIVTARVTTHAAVGDGGGDGGEDAASIREFSVMGRTDDVSAGTDSSSRRSNRVSGNGIRLHLPVVAARVDFVIQLV